MRECEFCLAFPEINHLHPWPEGCSDRDVQKRIFAFIGMILGVVAPAHAGVTLLLEEPYGTFGGMNPTGHAAIYLSRVCADSPLSLRRCQAGEHGVVISRYHRVSDYDWVAIPLMPYLYAVNRPDDVPLSVNAEDVALLRDSYRRANLETIVPDGDEGETPKGDWTQLVGAAYDRTIYAFGIDSTDDQDDAFIRSFNSRTNRRHFNLFFFNCADFARKAVDFYYPHAVHRSLLTDAGIMTPKQAARSLVSYTKRHKVEYSLLVIPQVEGAIPRSTPVRGVFESLVKSKRYAVPLVSVAVLHPYFGGSLAFAWISGARFDPRKMAAEDSIAIPAAIEIELQANRVAAPEQ
jgi:hypothetical protein